MKQIPQPSENDDKHAEGAVGRSASNSGVAAPMVDLEKAELPDVQSLADAIRHWQDGEQEPEGDEAAVAAETGIEAGIENTTETSDASVGFDGSAAGGQQGSSGAKKKFEARAPSGKAGSAKRVSRNQARRFARQRALQALYQWDVGKVDLSDVLQQFRDNQNLSNVDLDHFERLFRGVALAVDEIDVHLEPALDRPITDLDPVERSVLRLATCELRDCLQTPARVAINEAVELAKRFGADQGHKYVNGVIDKVAQALREAEMKAGKSS